MVCAGGAGGAQARARGTRLSAERVFGVPVALRARPAGGSGSVVALTKFAYAGETEPADMAALGFCTNERSLAESAAERAHCLEQVATGLRNAARLQQFIDMTQPRPLVHMPVRIMGQDINILTQIGFVVLVGLAAKNAILIVEFARDIEHEGRDQLDAVIEACRLRLRPILMTSFAFILGVLPLVISSGSGSEMRQAVGVAVFFGMLGVTAFGLIFTPIFYILVRRLFPGSVEVPAHKAELLDPIGS